MRFLLFGLIVGAATLAACARTAVVVPPPIKIATYEWPGSYWVDVAFDKGWFAEEGLNVERVDVDRKYFESEDEVAAGKLDVMGFTQFDLVRHVAAGQDLVGVVAIDYSEGAEALVAKPGIRRLRDLRGKTLAIRRGTYLEYLLSVVAEREGLNLADVNLVDRTDDNGLKDFEAGRVDAVFLWEPYLSQALAAGGVTLFSTTDFPGLTYSVLTLRRGFVDLHPAQVAALLRVWHRGERYVRERPEESCEIVARLFHEPLSDVRDLMRTVRVLDLADNGRAFSYAAGFESLHGSWRRMNDFMIEHDLVDSRVDSETHLDARFVRLLE